MDRDERRFCVDLLYLLCLFELGSAWFSRQSPRGDSNHRDLPGVFEYIVYCDLRTKHSLFLAKEKDLASNDFRDGDFPGPVLDLDFGYSIDKVTVKNDRRDRQLLDWISQQNLSEIHRCIPLWDVHSFLMSVIRIETESIYVVFNSRKRK